ncbi:hypothetical protein HT031_004846 [Scenedesmus sp. PABB004]|nr:hypothetical protein HT031_004846 [Scenedesmus sp. PABB004]
MLRTIGLLVLLGLAATARAQGGISAMDDITKADLSLFKQLAEMAGADKALAANDAVVTVLAPTNAALESFLTEMGITIEDLKANEALCDAILGYHLIVGEALTKEALFAKSKRVIVKTAVAPWDLIMSEGPDGMVTVEDFQKNTATVIKANLAKVGSHNVHVIDRVLMSGAYWASFKTMAKILPGYFSTALKATEKAGMAGTITAEGFSDTVFLPTNAAFKESGISLDVPAADIEAVLKYHVVHGARIIPGGVTSGEKLKTLQGQDITIELSTSGEKNARSGMTVGVATVVDANGNKATIVQPNVFVSKSTFQIIDRVLLPKAGAATAMETDAEHAAAEGVAAPAAAKPAEAAAPAEGKTLSIGGGKFGVKLTVKLPAKAVAAPAPAVAKPAIKIPDFKVPDIKLPTITKPTVTIPTIKLPSIPAKPTVSTSKVTVSVSKPTVSHPLASAGGRKLLQRGAANYGDTINLGASSAAILQAVNSGASLGTTSNAAAANLAGSNALIYYPTNTVYSDSIRNAYLGADGNPDDQ